MQSDNIYATVSKPKPACTPPVTPKPRRSQRSHPFSGISTVSADDDDCSPPLPPKPTTPQGQQQSDEIYTEIKPAPLLPSQPEEIYSDIEPGPIPVLPPKPQTKTAHSQQQPEEGIYSDVKQESEEIYSDVRPVLAEEMGPFSLSEFVSKCGRFLPLCITIGKGYEGDNERNSIATGDTYNIHFVKHSKVVVLKDSSNKTYNIPLNSPVQFAPVFHQSVQDDNTSDLIFDKVSDVIAHKPLPRLLRATKSHMTKDGKPLVEKNEVLAVKNVVTATLRRKMLGVYSVTQKKEKTLSNDCAGGFTADPYATRLHLPDIVSLFAEEFPLRVSVYLTDIEFNGDSDFPSHLESEISEITALRTETSLVASTYWGEGEGEGQGEGEDQCLIEIPIGLDIEVSLLRPGEREEVSEFDLFKRTKTFYESFHMAKIHTIRMGSGDLHMTARKGFEREGVQLEEPNRIYGVVGRVRLSSAPQSPAHLPPAHMSPPAPLSPAVPRRKIVPAVMHRRRVSAPTTEQYEVQGRGGGLESRHRGSGRQHKYQPLIVPANTDTSEGDVYVTMRPSPCNSPAKTGAKSEQAMLGGTPSHTATGGLPVEGHPPIIMQLITRIEKLEKQVAFLNDKVEKLTR